MKKSPLGAVTGHSGEYGGRVGTRACRYVPPIHPLDNGVGVTPEAVVDLWGAPSNHTDHTPQVTLSQHRSLRCI